jgi:RNA polymerase sigma-70 factor (ECF subfamily)
MPAEAPRDIVELLALARQGDRAAFGDLVEAYHDEVAAFVALRLPYREAIDEVVQASFIAAWQDLASFEPEGVFGAWLKGIARNRVLRWQREHQRRGRWVPLAAAEERPEPPVDDACGDLLPRLRRCLERLPAEARAALSARHVAGEDLDLLAGRLGLSVNALATRLCRWRSALRVCVERGGAGQP